MFNQIVIINNEIFVYKKYKLYLKLKSAYPIKVKK